MHMHMQQQLWRTLAPLALGCTYYGYTYFGCTEVVFTLAVLPMAVFLWLYLLRHTLVALALCCGALPARCCRPATAAAATAAAAAATATAAAAALRLACCRALLL